LKLALWVAVVLGLVATIYAAPVSPPPSAEDLLDHVIAQLPLEPIRMSGKLIVRRRRGVLLATYGFEMALHLGETPPRATYTILDAFGTPLERLSITWSNDRAPTFDFAEGAEFSPSSLSNLAQPIQQTDISWMDLTLSFLWWPNGNVVGEESIKGYDCYIVELPAPASNAGPYSRVKLWIDRKMHMMLQAEGYSQDLLRRRLWIKSCRKVNDRWMIKDMEIQKYPALHRTKLQILEVNGES